MGGWNAGSVAASVALFVLAGVFEVGGGWLVGSVREVRIIRRGTARASTPINRFRFFPGARGGGLCASPTSLAARPRLQPISPVAG